MVNDDVLDRLVRAYTRDRGSNIAVYGVTDDCQLYLLNVREIYGNKKKD